MLLAAFDGPPFTVQRLCELLSTPHKHHRTKLKLLSALDKLLSVTSVISESFSDPHVSLPWERRTRRFQTEV